DFPDGKFQPYVTAGPAIFFIDLDDGDETQVGIQVGAGVKWMFTKNLGLFAEYRYMSARDVEFEESEGASTVKIETDFNSHSVLGGLSFRF
ncbi:MAG: outer membrane beta-barrel protein, partial [bacterium]